MKEFLSFWFMCFLMACPMVLFIFAVVFSAIGLAPPPWRFSLEVCATALVAALPVAIFDWWMARQG